MHDLCTLLLSLDLIGRLEPSRTAEADTIREQQVKDAI